MGVGNRLGRLGANGAQLALKTGDGGLEREHPAHPLEIHPGRGQLEDVTQLLDVRVGVTAVPAVGAFGSSRPLRS